MGQGRGVGTALLRFLGAVADADGVPTYLETAGSRNTSFYADKGGYQVVHCSPVANFDHEGGGVAMQRPSGGKDGARRAAPGAPPQSSVDSSCCQSFKPKRPNGPLMKYCMNCGEHVDKCTAKK